MALTESSRVFWAVVRLGAVGTQLAAPAPPSLIDLLAGNVTGADVVAQGAETYEPRVWENVGVRLAPLSPTTRYDVHVVAADVARGNVQPAIYTLSFHTPPTRRYLESEYLKACAEEWHDGAQERMTWEFERVKADGSMSDSDLVNYAAELNRLFATCRSVDKHRQRGSVTHGQGGAGYQTYDDVGYDPRGGF